MDLALLFPEWKQFNRWFDIGLLEIKDIVKDHGLLLFDKKHASLFQEYNVRTKAIPKVWEKK